MAKRKVALRGRTIMAVVLASFLTVAVSVVWRRTIGSTSAARLQALSTRRAELEAQRAQLVGEIRRITSRPQLEPVVRRLGLKMPNDSQVIPLRRPARRGEGR
jgi:hypothetical protein